MNKRKIDLKIPLFFIWPFGAFLASFSSISSRSSQIIFIIFTTLFGYSFAFTETSADSYRVALVFNEFIYRDFPTILDEYLSGRQTDLYRYAVYSFFKSFSNNPKLVFGFFGFIFGIFSYKSIKLFFNVKGVEKSVYVTILLIIFISLNSVVNINGARFATGAIICLCSIISLVVYNKKIWLVGLLSTPLFHFSFLFISPVLILLYFLRKLLFKENKTSSWIYILFVFSFIGSFVLESNIVDITGIAKFLVPSIARKLELYNSAELAEVYEERGKSLFHTVSTVFRLCSRFFIFFLIFKIKKNMKTSVNKNPDLQMLFNFSLFFFSITFMLSLFPSGGRFVAIATQVFFFFLLRYFILYKSDALQKYILVFVPCYSFLIAFNIFFLGIALTNGAIWYGNLFWIIYEGIGYEFIYL